MSLHATILCKKYWTSIIKAHTRKQVFFAWNEGIQIRTNFSLHECTCKYFLREWILKVLRRRGIVIFSLSFANIYKLLNQGCTFFYLVHILLLLPVLPDWELCQIHQGLDPENVFDAELKNRPFKINLLFVRTYFSLFAVLCMGKNFTIATIYFLSSCCSFTTY